MKDEPTLDSAGPMTIIAFVAIVTGIALGLTLDANTNWGRSPGTSLQASSAEADPDH